MISKDVKRLLLKLNDPMTRALEGAAGLAVGRGHYEVTVEHLLLKLLEDGTGDAALILSRLDVDPGRVGKALHGVVEAYPTVDFGSYPVDKGEVRTIITLEADAARDSAAERIEDALAALLNALPDGVLVGVCAVSSDLSEPIKSPSPAARRS